MSQAHTISREAHILHYLGGSEVTGLRHKDLRQSQRLVQALRSGLPADSAERARELLHLDAKVFYRRVLPRQSLQAAHKRANQRLSKEHSERLYRAARVYALAAETFGSRARGERWMATPNPQLDGERPADFLDTEAGAEHIENLLGRALHGIDA